MSAFDALDVRGPDARRKQLLAKLIQQAQASSGSPTGAASVSGPAHFGGLAEGRSFRNATDVHRAGALPITQSSNVLSSVLAKLGVVGRSHASEVSQGQGMAIDVAHPDRVQGHPDVTSDPAGGETALGMPVAPEPGGTPTTPPPATDVQGSAPAPVPLGNGLFYDPVTDSVRGTPSGGGTGAGIADPSQIAGRVGAAARRFR